MENSNKDDDGDGVRYPVLRAVGLRLGQRDLEAMTTRGNKQQAKPVGSAPAPVHETRLRGRWFSPAPCRPAQRQKARFSRFGI